MRNLHTTPPADSGIGFPKPDCNSSTLLGVTYGPSAGCSVGSSKPEWAGSTPAWPASL